MSKVTCYSDIISNDFNLAPSQLVTLSVNNKKFFYLKDLLCRKLEPSDNGDEVGSVNYISKSHKYFIRAKALQSNCFLPVINHQTSVPITPASFINHSLKAGDILISKDSNIGEVVILDEDLPNHSISGALYKLPIENHKYYIFAFLKHEYFLKQLDLMVPKGSTIRHAKTLFLDCKIPFPSQQNESNVIEYISLLTQAIINKEKIIKAKHSKIINEIECEISQNQMVKNYEYQYPNLNELKKHSRLNAGFYSKYFLENENKIKNYKNGFSNLEDLGFKISRGQNLQVSNIGISLHSKQKKNGFYTVIKPKHLSLYGTDIGCDYLGNSKELKTLKSGDIIFGAEGFEKGRSMVVLNDLDNTITNIHGITINHLSGNIELSIFVKSFFDYLRKIGLIDIYAVGGNGGSLAMRYMRIIPFPIFPEDKLKKIVSYYHNSVSYPTSLTNDTFLAEDQNWNIKAGIVEVDKSLKQMKELLKNSLDKVINDEVVITKFDNIYNVEK